MDQASGDGASSYALPEPTDTPYRTPLGASPRNASPVPDPPSSPPMPPLQNAASRSRAGTPDVNVKDMSNMDPRRITPTLHASLVGEILSLRRELENKNKDITQLEETLHHTKTENEQLSETLQTNAKDHRTLKKQMQLLEGGTLSALDELAKERDEALGTLSEMHKRLEQTQKKARSHEEQAERTQRMYESDKLTWEADRRALETKVHIVEGRLKVVLNEVAAAQEVNPLMGSPVRTGSKRSNQDGSVRSESVASTRPRVSFTRRRASTASSGPSTPLRAPQRSSVMSNANGPIDGPSTLSLADELNLSEDEEDEEEDEDEEALHDQQEAEDEEGQSEVDSPDALPDERSASRLSDNKARKLLGLSVDATHALEPADLEELSLLEEEPEPAEGIALEYHDTGTQYSPPTTPIVSPQIAPRQDKLEPVKEESGTSLQDVVANQGRKRVKEKSIDDLREAAQPELHMKSTSCQTVGDLPSPPITPRAVTVDGLPLQGLNTQPIEMLTKETQTDVIEESSRLSFLSSILPIPKITIHPPSTRPSTPRQGVVLPPHTKNAACQVDMVVLAQLRSIGIQTEEIRVDKRAVKLPPHLMAPAVIRSKSPEPEQRRKPTRKLRNPPPVASNIQSLQRPEKQTSLARNVPTASIDSDRPTIRPKPDIRPPERSSSLFAGFEEEEDDPKSARAIDDVFSDDDMFNRPTVSYTLKRGKMVSRTRPFRDDDFEAEMDETNDGPSNKSVVLGDTRRSKAGLFDDLEDKKEGDTVPSRSAQGRSKPTHRSSGSRSANIRRTALISSGASAHQAGRARSPSLPNDNPPFPVPTRHSSRKIPISHSDGARSPTPNSGGRLSYEEERKVRRSRSAAAVSHQDRSRNISPPPLSSTTIPESPSLPPMPADQVSPFGGYETFRSPDPNQWSSSARNDSLAGSSSTAQITVVDAIAQTMVGEWMWKYVRRGKAFGPSAFKESEWEHNSKPGEEISAVITNTGVRHKRWVWLAPYERAVMWSSKQPTTGPALLGKSGRKLAIQSVLDVKDDNVMVKGSGPCFNRSILILTPQRALKFTAFTQERHYIWLSALSFLSHSPNDIADLALAPTEIPFEQAAPPPLPSRSSRRPAIRDSIRVTKGRNAGTLNEGMRAFTDGNISRIAENREQPLTYTSDFPVYEDQHGEAAEGPTIPRTSLHSRKRSNTAPKPPPTSFRTRPSFSNYASSSRGSAGSSSLEQQPHPTFSSSLIHNRPPSLSSGMGNPSITTNGGIQSTRSSMSRRTSVSSGQPSHAINNYFDTLGTVRMEAFVDRQQNGENQNSQARPAPHVSSRSSYRTRQGRKKDLSYWGGPPSSTQTSVPAGVATNDFGSVGLGLRSEGSRDSWASKGDDPFKGF